MLEQMIKTVLEKTIKQDFPQMLLPMCVKAIITKAEAAGDSYTYNLKILEPNGEIDSGYCEVPGVYSPLNIPCGAQVVIILLYGQLDVYIVGRVT